MDDNTPISPMKLAKLLKIRPQEIYAMIRRGQVEDVGPEGKKMVLPSEVIAARATPRKVGRPSTDSVLEHFNTRKGEILTWVVEVQKQVAVVDGIGEHLVTSQGMLRDRLRKPKEIFMKKTTLSQHIKDGVITSDDNWQVLEAIVLAWRLSGREQLADSLQSWLAVNKEEGENVTQSTTSPEEASQAPDTGTTNAGS